MCLQQLDLYDYYTYYIMISFVWVFQAEAGAADQQQV